MKILLNFLVLKFILLNPTKRLKLYEISTEVLLNIGIKFLPVLSNLTKGLLKLQFLN
jgi:hypothetical protein